MVRAVVVAPRLREVAPELEAELTELLVQAGELDLAKQVAELAIFDRCRCGGNFCSTFYTIPEQTTPFPKGFRTLALLPSELHLDVFGATIMQVEVLYRDYLRAKILAAVP